MEFRPGWIQRIRPPACADLGHDAAGGQGLQRPAARLALGDSNGLRRGGKLGGTTRRDPDVPVYLLVKKGNFTADHATMPPCAHASAGHFFYTVVDAATFVKMSEWLTNQTLPGRLKTIGPASSLPCLPCLS
jgi:hypothetical protein